MELRPYRPSDAETILSWCGDELTFRRWTFDRYDHYPITAADMNEKYIDNNGDCAPGAFYPVVAYDEGEPVGHLIMRYTDPERKTVRLGLVILDDKKRGKGHGKQMIRAAIDYAFSELNAQRVTIGVFDNNPSAYYCYKSAGFTELDDYEPEYFDYNGERWKVAEFEINK